MQKSSIFLIVVHVAPNNFHTLCVLFERLYELFYYALGQK